MYTVHEKITHIQNVVNKKSRVSVYAVVYLARNGHTRRQLDERLEVSSGAHEQARRCLVGVRRVRRRDRTRGGAAMD